MHSIYVFSLPPGPIWALHGFYLVTTGVMLLLYMRYGAAEIQPVLGSDHSVLRSFEMALETRSYSEAKADAFADSMLDVLNKGALALLTAVGHRTGLLDTMESLTPSISKEIAEAADLNERYVREWLGGMFTAGVIEYDSRSSKYKLPAEHAAFMTRSSSPNNIAAFTQYIGMFGTVER